VTTSANVSSRSLLSAPGEGDLLISHRENAKEEGHKPPWWNLHQRFCVSAFRSW
jgi:hypothetical protein